MSEYQYYEFLALNAPLSQRQQRELRAILSRDHLGLACAKQLRWLA